MNRQFMLNIFDDETTTTTTTLIDNTIVTTDIEPAISIDFESRFVQSIADIQRVLGINALRPMNEGTLIKQYEVTLGDIAEQVGEGEVINLTKATRSLKNSWEIGFKKYRKLVTAEAIQRDGREHALNDTDDALLRALQKQIRTDFFESLGKGTGTVANGSLQKVLATMWGTMQNTFQDYDVTPIYFVNPMDVAEYLGTATISTQTAFGFSYMEDFLGLGTVMLTPSITKGTVKGTVTENLNGAYIPTSAPSLSDFGLTSDATGIVGMSHAPVRERLSLETLLVSGVTFYAEDLSKIWKATLNNPA